MNKKAIIGAAAVLAVALIIAVAASIYFSPFHSCMRELRGSDPRERPTNPALMCTYATSGKSHY